MRPRSICQTQCHQMPTLLSSTVPACITLSLFVLAPISTCRTICIAPMPVRVLGAWRYMLLPDQLWADGADGADGAVAGVDGAGAGAVADGAVAGDADDTGADELWADGDGAVG